jgi:chemosensory pili system protein ChpA (sensor histidine kinase/response regulator)
VVGEDQEIDRSILNRMVGPLEHLLRNAVAHGIETPEDRAASDKPAGGKVSLLLAREGADMVLTISDDGRGLDRDGIRAKAIERGLLDPDADVTDDDLYQFVLAAGFTTAREVTQIAGRGVGMDAVIAEVKELGGTLEIASEPGRGSSFTIRLPFTLAISQALLIQIGDDVFAVPHGDAEVLVRVSRRDLYECYSGRRETIEYQGREYRVGNLANMLGIGAPALPEGQKWFPALMVRAGEHHMALHVDHLIGHSQIVVKSLGTQLNAVRWFTGGTILPDGRIALILDLGAVVRAGISKPMARIEQVMPEEEEQGVSVMVVDDSITVRKVTTRLLERHNMTVITAKDGVDAITVLQDHKPDIMLLDIEMPRMDGYELARHVRNTPELAHIPLIMITSRTGDKHRKRAEDLGVDRYLGKPYQEAELLDHIYSVLGERVDA